MHKNSAFVKPVVLYHAHCLDGYAAAWAAWKSLGNTAKYQAVTHQRPMPDFAQGADLYIVDFCYPMQDLIQAAKRANKIVVLDHHISAQEAYKACQGEIPSNLELHFNMQKSGCKIAWDYFQGDKEPPQLLQHIEDHDLWRHELEHTEEIMKALFVRRPIAFNQFEGIKLETLYREGRVLLKQHKQMVKGLLNSRHSISLDGQIGLAVNAPGAYASDLGHALAKLSGTYGLTYHYHGKRQCYECGLRSMGEFDVAAIAVAMGGGGHLNAAGFSVSKKDFLKILG
ncbi:MAG: DHH family phosphoesterase [Methyloprofundus sp.]|nr:DHH family phosphoesterase [Methyloprofundus sp.]